MGGGKNSGIPVYPPTPGGYQLAFKAYPPYFTMDPIFDNVVFDDVDGKSSLLGLTDTANVGLTAIGNMITTKRNVYPPIFNLLTATDETKDPIDGISVGLEGNTYAAMTRRSSPTLAYPCAHRPSFMVGDLFASVRTFPASGRSTNLRYVEITEGDSVTLNAVLQPAMSQSTLYLDNSYSAVPGLLALASPALTKPVKFYEGRTMVGEATLSANGTLASKTLKHVDSGIHIYSAQYPGDAYYGKMEFGLVVVLVHPRCHDHPYTNCSRSPLNGNVRR